MSTPSTRNGDKPHPFVPMRRLAPTGHVAGRTPRKLSPHLRWAGAIAARLGAQMAPPWQRAQAMTFLRPRILCRTHRETVVLRYGAGIAPLSLTFHFMSRAMGPTAEKSLPVARPTAMAPTGTLIKTAAQGPAGRIGNPVAMQFVSRLAGGSAACGIGPASPLFTPRVGRVVRSEPFAAGHSLVQRPIAARAGIARAHEIAEASSSSPRPASGLILARVALAEGAEPIVRKYRRVDAQPSPLRDQAGAELEWDRGSRNALVRRSATARRVTANDEFGALDRESLGRVAQPAAPINMAQITDAVLQQLDRRLIAARERMGRI